MERDTMISEMVRFLSEYEYDEGLNYSPTAHGCGVIFDTEMRNKATLISALEKHPNYNGNGQIVLDEKFCRNRDNATIDSFKNWLFTFTKKRLEYEFTEREVVRVKKNIDWNPENWVMEMDSWKGKDVVTDADDRDGNIRCHLLGETADRWGLYNSWWFRADTLVRFDGTEYASRFCEVAQIDRDDYSTICTIIDDGQYLSEEVTNLANTRFDWLRAHVGQKTSRIVKKICDHFGFPKHSEWNSRYTKFADAINPLEVDTWTIISWNPIDYWAMSFGNSWTSCHSVDKTDMNGVFDGSYHGCYSGGTESYMLDPSSVVVYVIDRSYKGNRFELEPKVMRQMFHIAEDGKSFVQGRLYPQDNDTGSKEKYDKFRAIVQRVVSECFGHLNYWDVKKGTRNCCSVIRSRGVHYRDYSYYDNCTLSTLKDGYTETTITVGHNPICPSCGSEHRDEECVQCPSCCSVNTCENCGDRISDDSYSAVCTYDERHFCCSDCAEAAGYVYCNDGEWHYNNREVCYDYYLDEYVYDYYEDFITVSNGNTYSNAENAEADGWRYVESEDRWYREDEVVYNEENDRYELEEVA